MLQVYQERQHILHLSLEQALFQVVLTQVHQHIFQLLLEQELVILVLVLKQLPQVEAIQLIYPILIINGYMD
jgi:hypothetical protein